MARRAPERDPRRAHDRDLPAHGVHVLVLDTAQRARAEPRAHHERVDRLAHLHRPRAEDVRAALDDLRDVLHCPTHEGAPGGEEAREEVGEVDGRVDVHG